MISGLATLLPAKEEQAAETHQASARRWRHDIVGGGRLSSACCVHSRWVTAMRVHRRWVTAIHTRDGCPSETDCFFLRRHFFFSSSSPSSAATCITAEEAAEERLQRREEEVFVFSMRVNERVPLSSEVPLTECLSTVMQSYSVFAVMFCFAIVLGLCKRADSSL